MTEAPSSMRFGAADLREFVARLFEIAGLDREKAEAVSVHLVAAEQMGRPSHGLVQASRYLADIRSEEMTRNGMPDVIADTGGCLTWDGRMLPGMWLTGKAVEAAIDRAGKTGSAIVAVRQCHHTGALVTYLQEVTSRGFMAILATSAPGNNGLMAPFGGTRPIFTTNPIAAGIPTATDPILLDTSASIVANNKTKGMARRGERATADWYLDAEGNPTNDPAVILEGGTVLPAGGVDHGHKGYSWAILVAILTQALSGAHGPDSSKGSSIFVHIIDPQAMAGADVFVNCSEALVEACRTNPPRPGGDPVRMPGQMALWRQRESEENGVALATATVETLKSDAEKLGLSLPPELIE